MASKKMSKPKRVDYKGFHNVNLTKEDESLFEAWREENVTAFNWIEALADEGYKVSFNYDAYNEGFKASLYAESAKMAWAGYTMTSWAGDIQTAFDLLCFKHYVMCKQDWDVARDVSKRNTSNYG